MIDCPSTRRAAAEAVAGMAAVIALDVVSLGCALDKSVTVGLDLSLTGAGRDEYTQDGTDKATVSVIGPQMSGVGKAMAPILSQGDLAIVTPGSTNPDVTDPQYAAQYRPAGKAIYFRTVATGAYQVATWLTIMPTCGT